MEGLFTTCDTPGSVGDIGSLPDVLQTATFSKDPEFQLQALKKLQPNRALMVMEYWSGWYDHWLDENHQTGLSNAEFQDTLKKILNLNASVNIYMFFGGTDFGFMNGADPLSSSPFYAYDASSYDYAAPLSEAGDYTEKYSIVENIVSEYNTVKTKLPEKPKESKKYAYPSVPITSYLTGEDIIARIDAKDKVKETTVQSMESLNINNLNGQSYGYINYRKRVNLTTDSHLKIIGHPRDIVMLMLDGDQKTNILSEPTDLTGFGYWVNGDQEFAFNEADAGDRQLDLLVENWGRCNYGYPKDFDQRKGLWEGPVVIDGIEQKGWEITAVQFEKDWIDSLQGWRNMSEKAIEKGPALLRGTFEVEETLDTWIDMRNWGKGVVIFEQYKPALEVTFSNKPTYRNLANETIQGSI
ncbi:hypothetical protein J437_LFUL010555 [Ladona fulva]|uniref:Glycoside hydrolase 35 catalytic domain-containing protein n=1 Tax=Ladona fulva TaxID=123851 RepID=A0A8K0KFU6_LADFU|nr:hypothetical protein J437_LFUL010555 [Ladona fulva]